jgi:putative ABC transport system ATP-binding protein
VGFVFQFYNLIPSLTARENVQLVTDIAEAPMRPEEALSMVGLGERLDFFPAQLSGGEQQRVAFARALIMDPPILLADEPTGNLDSKAGEGIIDLLEASNAAGRTIVLVTHDLRLASRAQRIVHLRDGEITDVTYPTPRDRALEEVLHVGDPDPRVR